MNRNGMRHVLIRTGHCVCAMCNVERMSSSSSSDDDEESKRDKKTHFSRRGKNDLVWEPGGWTVGNIYITR